MSTELPRVSVIVPTHNGEATIGACIESLLATRYPCALREVLVVDNMSTDHTRDVVSRYPVVALREDQRRGAYAARNLGLTHATGQVLAFTDDDCVVNPDWLDRGVACLADPAVGCVAGAIRAEGATNAVERYLQARREHDPRLTFGKGHPPWASGGNAFYRRSVFDRLGPFDESMFSGGDVEMSWRAQLRGGVRLAYCPEAVVHHRHASTLHGFWRQQKRYGMGRVLVYQRHPEVEPPRGWGETYWKWRLLVENGLGLLRRYHRYAKRRGPRGFLESPEVLRLVQRVAYNWGRLCGSVRFRTFYP